MAELGTESYYRQLCETMGIALLATDVDLNIRVWNAPAGRMFGAEEALMIGAPIISMLQQASRGPVEGLLRDSLETGRTNHFEFEHRDGQGDHRELAGTIAPIVSEGGERIGVSVCFRDITKRIGLQQEVVENRKMVAMGEMAGAVAHHFNNILGGIVTSIDFARSQQNPLVDRRVLEHVGDALGKATSLISGLLAFSEGDKRTEDFADLTETLYELADDTEERVRDSQITLEVSFDPLPVVPVKRLAVHNALTNIIQNAIEAMPDGGELGIGARRVGGAVEITVRDTGVGLDEATRERIFEPFWTTKGVLGLGEGNAVGLGLAIAHGLAQMMGATITVRSMPSAGSTFTLRIPIPDEGAD